MCVDAFCLDVRSREDCTLQADEGRKGQYHGELATKNANTLTHRSIPIARWCETSGSIREPADEG